MNYSFVKPKLKPVFNLYTKIWIILFSFGVIFISVISLIFFIKIKIIDFQILNMKQEVVISKKKIAMAKLDYEILYEKKQIADFINSDNGSNSYLKESVKNLFDLIIKTKYIKLDYIAYDKNSLQLRGITPTKEMFALLVETPLKSVFDESYTDFYKLENGWFRFSNSNKKIGINDER